MASMMRSRLLALRKGLFGSWWDGLITVTLMAILLLALRAAAQWALKDADWSVVSTNLPLYLLGSFPPEEQWRPLSWMVTLLLLTLATALMPLWRITCPGAISSLLAKLLPAAWILSIPAGLLLLAGGLGLAPVATRSWGGLCLTLILTLMSGVLALPIGIALAVGRWSGLPLIRGVCSLYIELMRAIPLLSVLFFGQLLIPLFLPAHLEVNRVMRAVLALAWFAAAYVAEDVRGGLQAIPRTQQEAAEALGLSLQQVLGLVLLPQALRFALPSLANQAVGLLQNSTLLAMLGLVELLGISRSLLANPLFIGRYLEVYAFLAVVYWLLCTLMSLLARSLEHHLRTA